MNICWDSSSVIFQEVPLTDSERRFSEKLTRVIMNATVEVDEYHEMQRHLPPSDVTFTAGDASLNTEIPQVQRTIFKRACEGYGRDELLQTKEYTERQATIHLLSLIREGFLDVKENPYVEYARRSIDAYTSRADLSLIETLSNDFQKLNPELPANLNLQADQVDVDWGQAAPIILLAGNKPDHVRRLTETLQKLYLGWSGNLPAERRHLGGTITIRLSFGHHYLDVIQLPSTLDRATLSWLDPQVSHVAGVIFMASDQDRFSSAQNLRMIRLLRLRFKGVYYHVVPRIMDGGVAIFKMDCEHCGYKLAVDIDAVGESGICPICNAEIVMPDCLDNLAKMLQLPREVPVVQAQPDSPYHARDLLLLVLDTIMHTVEQGREKEPV